MIKHKLFVAALLVGVLGTVAVVAGRAQAGARSAKSAGPITRVAPMASAVTSSAASPASLPFGSVFIHNNFGPSDGYNCCTAWTVGASASVPGLFRAANAFVPATSAWVTQIDVALSNAAGTNNATISLASDNGGVPGTILGSWSVANQPVFGSLSCCVVATIQTGRLIPLGAGRQFWLIVDGGPNVANNTWDTWNWNTTGDTGLDAYNTGAGWVLQPDMTLGAFDVIGCPKICKVQ